MVVMRRKRKMSARSVFASAMLFLLMVAGSTIEVIVDYLEEKERRAEQKYNDAEFERRTHDAL
jgi:hypothetical protein